MAAKAAGWHIHGSGRSCWANLGFVLVLVLQQLQETHIAAWQAEVLQ
jgi:hypothetical protein